MTVTDVLLQQTGILGQMQGLKAALLPTLKPGSDGGLLASSEKLIPLLQGDPAKLGMAVNALTQAVSSIQKKAKEPKNPTLLATLAVLTGAGPDYMPKGASVNKAFGLESLLQAAWTAIGFAAVGIAGYTARWQGDTALELKLPTRVVSHWTSIAEGFTSKAALPYLIAAGIAQTGGDIKTVTRTSISPAAFAPALVALLRTTT